MHGKVFLGLVAALVLVAAWGQGQQNGEPQKDLPEPGQSALAQGRLGEKEGPAKADSQRAKAIKFLRDHVIGKTVVTPETIAKVDGGKMEAVLSGSETYTNLVETESGFKFDDFSNFKQTNYDLDKDGKRILPGQNKDGLELVQYELSERKCTGKLVGSYRIVSSTSKFFMAGSTSGVLMEVKGDGLHFKEFSIAYEDFSAVGGKCKPGAYEATYHFYVKGGKLHGEGQTQHFEVDTATLKKTLSAAPPTKWLNKQVD
jgi:hypothetical protein